MPHRFFALADVGRRRQNNQDNAAAIALPAGFTLLIVADGVGGAGGGETASEETVNAIVASMWAEEITNPVDALQKAAAEANKRVREMQKTDARLSHMATTLVAALVHGDQAWIYNVGDSRAYKCAKGTLDPVTQDDSWVAEQVRQGNLTADEASRSPYQNVITKGVGVEEDLPVDRMVHQRLNDGDTLLLCSDGLYRAVTPEKIVEAFADEPTMEDAAKRLVELANAAGGPDNISVAIYHHDSS